MNLLKIFRDGTVRQVILTPTFPANVISPLYGYAWFVLGGNIKHVTGTDSVVIKMPRPERMDSTGISEAGLKKTFYRLVDDALASDDYPLFPVTVESGSKAQNPPLFVFDNEMLYFAGDSSAAVVLLVLEGKVV